MARHPTETAGPHAGGLGALLRRRRGGDDAVPFLHQRIRQELLSQLDYLRLEPQVVVNLGHGAPPPAAALWRRYRPRHLLLAETSLPSALASRRHRPWFSRVSALCCRPEALPLPDGSADLVVADMLLPRLADVSAVLRECARVLTRGGVLLVSAAGPDTLKELRAAWGRVDRHSHLHSYMDMHDLGDAMVAAGLAEPVLSADPLTVEYPDLDGLLRDVASWRGGNATTGRAAGLTTAGRLQQVETVYRTDFGHHGRLPATVELIYAHAWGSGRGNRSRGDARLATFPVEQLRGSGRRR